MKPLSYRGGHKEPLVAPSHEVSGVKCFRLYGLGARFLNSVSQQYSDEYPGELSDSIPESDFIRTMARINRLLATFWPCTTFYVCGLACSPCTLALGLCCPVMCRPEVESRLLDDLRDISLHARYYDRGIVWQLNKTLFGSSIEIVVPDDGLMTGHVDVEVGHGNKES